MFGEKRGLRQSSFEGIVLANYDRIARSCIVQISWTDRWARATTESGGIRKKFGDFGIAVVTNAFIVIGERTRHARICGGDRELGAVSQAV